MNIEELWHRGVHSEFSGRIQDGEAFQLTRTSGSQAQNARLELHIRVGTRPLVLHVHPAISQNGLLEVAEGSTFSASGTQLTPRNRNRRATKTPESTFWYAPTVSASGTILSSEFLPGGAGGNATGHQGVREEDWILSPGSGYLVSLGNLAASAAITTLAFNFFELASGEV